VEELDLLKNVFISNGYPPSLVRKTIAISWKTAEQKKCQEMIETDAVNEEAKEFFDTIHVPFVENFTQYIQRELRKINVGVVMKKGPTIFSKVCKMKSHKELQKSKDVIYAIECKSCKRQYIGETSKTFEERRHQHQGCVKRGEMSNGISAHLNENMDHKIEWEDFKILDKESIWARRKIKEALYIQIADKGNDLRNLMNLDKGWELDRRWHAITRDLQIMNAIDDVTQEDEAIMENISD
jgi:hypothetical protein